MANEINYQVKSSAKARHIRIAVYPDGRVLVTKPVRIPLALANHFVNRKWSWVVSKVNFYKNKKTVLLPNPTIFTREQALDIVKARIEFYNQHYGLVYHKVSIKNHKSLWGSCSRRNNLNFNFKIVQLSQIQMDYIIVHELCHLKEFNHSQNFWTLVAQTIPDYKQIKKELKNFSFM